MPGVILTALLLISPFFSNPLVAQSEEKKKSYARGKVIYQNYCIACHLENGEGIPFVFPPLAKSDYLMADKKRAISTVLFGLYEEIVVNGITYYSEMLPQELNDQEIADVLTFVMNSWGNSGEQVTPEEVRSERN